MRSLRGATVLALFALAACTEGGGAPQQSQSRHVGPPYEFKYAPISSIVVDDYATGGILTVPPNTEFGLELSGGGWTINRPDSWEPLRMIRGPGSWNPDLGFLGPGNCDSASPCGGMGAVFKTTAPGYTEVTASSTESIVFDLHLQVKAGVAVRLDVPAIPIINESLSTSVTAPVGSTVVVHLTGNWAAPTVDQVDIELFKEEHLATTGVVQLLSTERAANESIYTYAITGKGGYAYEFKYLDPSPFAGAYTIGFDIR